MVGTGIGERVKKRRLELGLTQTELAKKLGYNSKSSVCLVEKGDDNMTLDRVEKFAEALNTTASYIMGWDDNLTEENADFSVDMLTDSQFLFYAKKLFYSDAETKVKAYSYLDFLFNSANSTK